MAERGTVPPGQGVGAIAEALAVERLLVPLHRRASWLVRAARPLTTRSVYAIAAPWRRSLLENAALVLGPESSATARRAFALAVLGNMQRFIGEVVTASDAPIERLQSDMARFEGLDPYLEARARHRGMILVSIHMGPFEPALAILRRYEPRPLHVVFAQDRLHGFEAMRSRLRRRIGVIEQPVDAGLATWTALAAALERREVVILLGDRVQAGQPGAAVPLLSGCARLPTAPIKLAMMTGAPIVPVYCRRTPDGIEIIAERGIRVEPGFSRDLAAHPAMLELVASMERRILAHPQEWLAVHRVAVASGPSRVDRG